MHAKFRNKKSGDIYILYGYAVNKTDGHEDQEMCLYYKEDDKSVPRQKYVRNSEEFLENFTLVEDTSIVKLKLTYSKDSEVFSDFTSIKSTYPNTSNGWSYNSTYIPWSV